MDLIPLSGAVKQKLDLAAVPGALSTPFLSSWTWAELAACLAAIYTVLRIIEWGVAQAIRLRQWARDRKSAGSATERVDE